MTRMRVTNSSWNLDVAGTIVPESGVRRIIFRYVCQDVDNATPKELLLAQQVEAECFQHLTPKCSLWTHSFNDKADPSIISETQLSVRRLLGNAYLVDITAEDDTTHEPLLLLCEKFPQYGVVYTAAQVRFTSGNGYKTYLGVIAQAINETLNRILGASQRVSTQDLIPVLNDRICEIEIPTKALFLSAYLDENPETGEDQMLIELSNWLARWTDIPPTGARLPQANEVVFLVQFVKTLNERLSSFYG